MATLLPDLGSPSAAFSAAHCLRWELFWTLWHVPACLLLCREIQRAQGTSNQCMQVIINMCHVPERVHMHLSDARDEAMASHLLLFIATLVCEGSCMHAFLLSSIC